MKRAATISGAVAFLVIFLSGCLGNRPVKRPTLEDEARTYARRYDEDLSLGRYHQAIRDAMHSLAIYRALDMGRETGISLNKLGAVRDRLGMVDKALASYREAIALSREINDDGTLAAALNNLAGTLATTNPAQAATLANEAGDIASARGLTIVKARTLSVLATISFASGDLKKAGTLCRQALKLSAGGGGESVRAACMATLGRLLARSGDPDAGLESVKSGLAIDRERGDPFSIARDYQAMAEVQDAMHDMEGAEKSLEKAEHILRFLGLKPDNDDFSRPDP